MKKNRIATIWANKVERERLVYELLGNLISELPTTTIGFFRRNQMKVIKIKASWNAVLGRMEVELDIDGHRYIEVFNREDWASFIKKIDEGTLRIGGLTLDIDGMGHEKAVAGIKKYLKEVDYAFQRTGHTEYLNH